MKIEKWYRRVCSYLPELEISAVFDLSAWRSWYIRILIFITITIFPLSMAVTIPAHIREGQTVLIVMNCAIWVLLLFMFFSKRLSFHINAFLWLTIMYTFTIAFFFYLGPHHARSAWLVMCSVMASLLFGSRAAVFSVVFNAILLMLMYGFIGRDNPAWSNEFSAPMISWIVFVTNVSAVTLLTSLPVGMLLKRLDLTFKSERNYSEKLKTEKEKLSESEKKYKQFIDSAKDMIFIVDVNGYLTYLNPYATKIFGYSAEEICGKNILELICHDYRENAKVFYREQFLKKTPNTYNEIPANTKDNRVVWVGLKMQALFEGNRISGFQGLARDITERKKAEEALKESKEKYQLLFDNATDGIFIAQDGLFKFPNPKLAEITGYSQEELETMPLVEVVHPEDKQMVSEYHRQRMAQDEHVPSTYTLKIIDKSGQERCVELSAVFILWEGHPASLNFARDITPQKHMELQLLQAQKMEAVGTLAGGIAHDFNNSLQAILGYTQILLLEMNGKSGDAAILRQVEKAALRSKELTQQLLTYSRKVESNLAPMKLNQEVFRLETLLRRTIPKMIDIKLILAKDLHIINADAVQIEQVLMNLCINARDAMPEGGTLTIETENITLDKDYARTHLGANPGNYVLLSISDTGIGIDKKALNHIFEPFYTTKEKGDGTGLGLAMVYGIVKNHGGYIMCYSEPGEGTVFKIYFPVIDGPVISLPDSEENTELMGGTETILLVDDEDFIREVAEKILVKFGYTVLTAPDGEKALDIYREKKEGISLVILDLIMPGMGGKKCLEKILDINPAQSVIIASGYSVNGQTQEALNLGAKGYLKKPYELESMLALVREVLDKN